MSEIEVLLPKWGLTMTEATVVEWLKAPGDAVELGEPIVEVETEKANAEVESPAAGVLGRILHEAGAVVEVGEPLAVLGVEGPVKAAPAASEGGSSTPAAGPAAPIRRESARPSAPARSEAKPPRASPVARRVAAELGVDLSLLEGTGARGLISEGDVRAAAAAGPAEPQQTADLQPAHKRKLTARRRAIGAALSRNLAQSPQVTLTRAADASGLEQLRRDAGAEHTVNDLLIVATASALASHEALNAHLVDNEIWIFDEVNIGLAVDLDDGLIVPVLEGVGELTLAEIRSERLRLVESVRAGTTEPAELMNGTFTITNLGAWGIDAFTPIINPPQVAILGVGRLVERPAVIDGTLAPRAEMALSVTFDHRALDGKAAAEFLAELCELLASAERLGELVSS